MKAAFYTKRGQAKDVLRVQEFQDVLPRDNEVQVQIHYSGVNPGEVAKRASSDGSAMPYKMVIPHSDGAGYISQVGSEVEERWLGKKVLCFGAQSYRPYGTAAEYCCVPIENVVELAEHVDLQQASQIGIPGITAHRAVHVGGDTVRRYRTGQTVLVHGGGGAVGQCAIVLAKKAGAVVLASVRRQSELGRVYAAGAHEVYLSDTGLKDKVLADFPNGLDHVIEVAFAENIETDVAILKQGGSIATYATDQCPASIPFWPLVFSNISLHFLGSDDFSCVAKRAAAEDLAAALADGWEGLVIGEVYDLDDIARAHLHIEGRQRGRALLKVKQ